MSQAFSLSCHNICCANVCLLVDLQTVVDIATLTGAAGVALGQDTAALFANTDCLAAAVDGASRLTGASGLPLMPYVDMHCLHG